MLRFFVETLPLSALREPGLLLRVARAADGLVLAVRPADLRGLAAVVAAVRASGLAVALWPMLENDAGRWCTLANTPAFVDFARECMQGARAGDALLLDLEPPWRLLDALAHGRLREAARELPTFSPARSALSERRLADFSQELRGAGLEVHTAEFPWALAHPVVGRVFGVPHLHGSAQRGVMLYTSLLEGYARGLVKRRGATDLLRRFGTRALARLGQDVELQLGAVGAGALANEPVFRHVRELARDLELAVGMGARRIAVFDLGGILRRPDAEDWLETCAYARHLLCQHRPRGARGIP